MEEKDKKMKVATFRFGVIADFVNGTRLDYGEKEKLLDAKVAKVYEIPFSNQQRIARSTIEKWIQDYKRGGYHLEALHPKSRKDKGEVRSVPTHIKLAIKELKKENPALTLPTIITALKHKKLIGAEEKVNLSSLYRYWNNEELHSLNMAAVDKRHFEAKFPNELWQSDVMYGPMVRTETGGKNKQSYLIAILDDHSRLIIHCAFYLSERRESFLDCLRLAILKRGLPQTLYIDNGSCYRSLHLEQVTAQLGIAIKHSRPYTPQGRGKIERWFRYVRENFLQVLNLKEGESQPKLDYLNQCFSDWVDEYNNREHGSTKQSPLKRYQDGISHVKPAPNGLLDYFRQIEYRKVKKDRTIRVMGSIFEVPVGLIDRQVELRFHPEDLAQIEVYFDGRSYGFAVVANPHVNAMIGRNWDPKSPPKEKSVDLLKDDGQKKSGELFQKIIVSPQPPTVQKTEVGV
jgi:transposase InsO family protein